MKEDEEIKTAPAIPETAPPIAPAIPETAPPIAPTKCPYCGGKVIDHLYDCYSCERCHREFGPEEK